MRKSLRKDWALLFFFSLQAFFWWENKDVIPKLAIVTPPPTMREIYGFSLGDRQFYFRLLAFEMQSLGDTFGRSTPLKDYNFALLQKWFFRLDELDSKSNVLPSLASYYYSNSQNPEDCKYLVEYLEQHANKNIEEKWWWLAQAAYLANHKLKDKEWALRIAIKLQDLKRKDVPIWVRQLPAFIYEQMGEREQAMRIIVDILDHKELYSDGELNFMRYFIEDRLKKEIPEAFIEPKK